jgi:hypothetical protein
MNDNLICLLNQKSSRKQTFEFICFKGDQCLVQKLKFDPRLTDRLYPALQIY